MNSNRKNENGNSFVEEKKYLQSIETPLKEQAYNSSINSNIYIEQNNITLNENTDVAEKMSGDIAIKSKIKRLSCIYILLLCVAIGLVVFVLYRKNTRYIPTETDYIDGSDFGVIYPIPEYENGSQFSIENGFYVRDYYDENGNFLYKKKYCYLPQNTAIASAGGDSYMTVNSGNQCFYEDGRLVKEITPEGETISYTYSKIDPSRVTRKVYNYLSGAVQYLEYNEVNSPTKSEICYPNGSLEDEYYDENNTIYTIMFDKSEKITQLLYCYLNGYNEVWCYNGDELSEVYLGCEEINEHYFDLSGYKKCSRSINDVGDTVTILESDVLTYKHVKSRNGDWTKEVFDLNGKLVFKTQFWNENKILLTLEYDADGYVTNWFSSLGRYTSKRGAACMSNAVSSVSYDSNSETVVLILTNGSAISKIYKFMNDGSIDFEKRENDTIIESYQIAEHYVDPNIVKGTENFSVDSNFIKMHDGDVIPDYLSDGKLRYFSE